MLCHATQSEGSERPEEACGSPHLRFSYNISSRIYSLAWALKINYKKTEATYVTKKFDIYSKLIYKDIRNIYDICLA